MKNNIIAMLLIVATCGFTTVSFTTVGELIEDVAQIPGRVVEGTGEMVTEVGEAVTPRRTQATRTVGETVVRAPGKVVSGTGEVVSEVGGAITPRTRRVHTKPMEETTEPPVVHKEFVCDACPVPEPCPVCDCPACH